MPYVYTPFQSREKFQPYEIPSLDREVLEETFALAFEENPIEAFSRYRERRSLETGFSGPRQGYRPVNRINAEQAKQMANDAGFTELTYNADTSAEAVQLDIDRKKTERRRQDIFSRSRGGVGLGAQRLAISIGTTLADPVSGLLNFVPVVGQTRYAKWLAGATRLGRVGIRAGVGAAEGLAGAAIYEPLLYSAKQAEQADYDAADSLLNLSLGTLTGAGLHAIGGTTADAYRAFRGLPDAYQRLTPGIQKAINDGKVDAPAINKADIDEGGVRLDTKLDEIAQVAADPAVPVRPPVKIETTPDREIIARSNNGETIARQRGDAVQVVESRTTEAGQRQGEGTERIRALISEAEKRDLRFVSDTKVSPAAAKVYDRLEKQGYAVKRNGFVTDDEGNLISDAGRPVFEVTASPRPANAAEAVSIATPQAREAALRIATDQLTNGEDIRVGTAFGKAGDTTAREVDATTVERSKEAESQVKDTDDSIEALEEEANVERQLTDQQAKQLGVENTELKASDDYIAKVERWANAAELAQVCLVRGG